MKRKPGQILYKKLLVKNRTVNFFLRVINSLYRNRENREIKGVFKKILICNNAHLGDVILSTAIIPIIKRNYPDAEIHFLCGSWSKEILMNHPLIEKVFFFDNWKLNRSPSLYKKIHNYAITFRNAVKNLSKENYDIAIDLYFHYPNCTFLLWKSSIPIRLGYTSGGFGNLLTNKIDWVYSKQSVLKYHLALIKLLFRVEPEEENLIKPILPPFSIESIDKLQRIYFTNTIEFGNYIAIHIGAGLPMREWPIVNWINLIKDLTACNFKVVLTGYGVREQKLTNNIVEAIPDCLNLCGKLSLLETAYVIKNARALICVDSVAGHLASAFETETIIIGNGIHDPYLWRSISKKAKFLFHPVPCMPCYSGCEGMECLRKVSVEEVVKSIAILN